MEWYCVLIDQSRLARTINVNFRTMLADTYERQGITSYCHVYLAKVPDGGSAYYFSPVAAQILEIFVKLWEGQPVPEPMNSAQMEVIL